MTTLDIPVQYREYGPTKNRKEQQGTFVLTVIFFLATTLNLSRTQTPTQTLAVFPNSFP